MTWKRLLPSVVGIGGLIAAGCGMGLGGYKGYKKVDGQWAWVARNVNGTSVAKIDADIDSFQILSDIRYGKDKYRVFRRWAVIEDADPETFELLSTTNYSKDKDHVFLRQHRIPGADPSTFEVIQAIFSRDATHVYCGTVQMNVKNVEDFEIVSSDAGSMSVSTCPHRQTFLHVYGDEFASLEISPEHPVIACNAWSRDGKHYFYGPARVQGADYESFRIIDRFTASDKNRDYHGRFPADEWAQRR